LIYDLKFEICPSKYTLRFALQNIDRWLISISTQKLLMNSVQISHDNQPYNFCMTVRFICAVLKINPKNAANE
jgi:hypothetical protein